MYSFIISKLDRNQTSKHSKKNKQTNKYTKKTNNMKIGQITFATVFLMGSSFAFSPMLVNNQVKYSTKTLFMAEESDDATTSHEAIDQLRSKLSVTRPNKDKVCYVFYYI